MRRGVIVYVGDVGGTEITEKVLEGYDIREGDFVIFHTGYLSKYSYGTRDYFRGHPQMSWDFIEVLAKMNLGFSGLSCRVVAEIPDTVQ